MSGMQAAAGAADWVQLGFAEAPIGLVVTEHRVIRACNQRFAEQLGYRVEELEGRSFRMLYDSADEFQRIRDVGLENLRRTGLYSDERMMPHRDGHPLWFRFRAHTLVPEDPLARIVMSFAMIRGGSGVRNLSPRERQVLSRLARGMTSKEIGRDLDLSPRTIEDVRARLLRRFEAKNTSELLVRLTDLGQ